MTTRAAPATIEKKPAVLSKRTLGRRLFLAAIICSFVLHYPRASAAEQVARARNEKLAEMAAMARHNERCPDIPRQWAIAYLTLLVATPPAEELVLAEERKTLSLRAEIGIVRWCQLYSVEMEQAYLIYRYITHR